MYDVMQTGKLPTSSRHKTVALMSRQQTAELNNITSQKTVIFAATVHPDHLTSCRIKLYVS
jgi:hypothetical protein